MNTETALYDPAFGISNADLCCLQNKSLELVALLAATTNSDELEIDDVQMLSAMAWDRALDIQEVGKRVGEQWLTDRLPLTFTNKEALEMERLVTLFRDLLRLRDDVPEVLQQDRESIDALRQKLRSRNRAAGLHALGDKTEAA